MIRLAPRRRYPLIGRYNFLIDQFVSTDPR